MAKKKKTRARHKRRAANEPEETEAPPDRVVAPAEGTQAKGVIKVPRADPPASVRFAAPQSKLTMTASTISKPSQSLVTSKTGVQFGAGRPVRVRVVR